MGRAAKRKRERRRQRRSEAKPLRLGLHFTGEVEPPTGCCQHGALLIERCVPCGRR